MGEARKRHSGAFKAHVAVAAIGGDRSMAELSGEFGVHPTAINRWKRQVLDLLPALLSGKVDSKEKEGEELVSRLYQEIGQLKVELGWLKKIKRSPLAKSGL